MKKLIILFLPIILCFSSCSLFGMYVLDFNNESTFSVKLEDDKSGKIVTLGPGETYGWGTTRIGGNNIIITCINGTGRGEANTVEDINVYIRNNSDNSGVYVTTFR